MLDETSTFLNVVNAAEFKYAWQKIVDVPLTYNEFCELHMPEGISHSDLWDAFTLMKRCMGESNKMRPWFKGVTIEQCWSYTPKSVEQDFLELSSLASPTSTLNAYLSGRSVADSAFEKNVVEEVASLARRDGMPISEESVRRIWRRQCRPADWREAIIEDVRRLFEGASHLAEKRYSAFLAYDVNDAISHRYQGVPLVRQLHFDVSHYNLERVNNSDFANEMFRECIKAANNATSFRDTIMATIIMADTLWDLPVWENFNSLTEFVLRRIYFIQKDMPALSYIPLSSRDELNADDFRKIHERESSTTPTQGLDSTWLYAGQVRIFLNSARELLADLDKARNEQSRIAAKIKDIAWLNTRQKNCLISLRASPFRLIKIDEYASVFSCSYATARQDLLLLEQKGLLEMIKVDRAFAYRLSSRINWNAL